MKPLRILLIFSSLFGALCVSVCLIVMTVGIKFHPREPARVACAVNPVGGELACEMDFETPWRFMEGPIHDDALKAELAFSSSTLEVTANYTAFHGLVPVTAVWTEKITGSELPVAACVIKTLPTGSILRVKCVPTQEKYTVDRALVRASYGMSFQGRPVFIEVI